MGKSERQVGQLYLACARHLLKHPRQKLCWQGACRRAWHTRGRAGEVQGVGLCAPLGVLHARTRPDRCDGGGLRAGALHAPHLAPQETRAECVKMWGRRGAGRACQDCVLGQHLLTCLPA